MLMLLHADASALSLRGRRTTQDTTPGSRAPRSLLFPELGESVPRTTTDSNFQANRGGAGRFPPGSPGPPASPAHSEPKFIPPAGPGSAGPVRRARRAPERVTPSRSRSRPVGAPAAPSARPPGGLRLRGETPGPGATSPAGHTPPWLQQLWRRKRTLSGPPSRRSPGRRFRPRRSTLPPSPWQARARGRRVPPRPFPGAGPGPPCCPAIQGSPPAPRMHSPFPRIRAARPRRLGSSRDERGERGALPAPARPWAPESDTARVPATGPAPEPLAWHEHRVQEKGGCVCRFSLEFSS